MVRYEPAFLRVRTFARLPNVQDLKNAGAAVVGAPFGTGKTFCVGARFGPEGIRSVSHQTSLRPALHISVTRVAETGQPCPEERQLLTSHPWPAGAPRVAYLAARLDRRGAHGPDPGP